MKRAIVAATLLALGSGAAMAQDNPSGFYIGGGIGQFNFESTIDGFPDFTDEVSDFNFDDDDNAWKVFAGYRFLPWLAAELNYVDFGRTEDTFESATEGGDVFVELSGIQPALVASIPVGPVELFARVGYLFYDIDLRFDPSAPGSDDANAADSEEAFSYGGGIGVTVFERVPLKIEYEEFDLDGGEEASAYWFTAAWRF